MYVPDAVLADLAFLADLEGQARRLSYAWLRQAHSLRSPKKLWILRSVCL